MSATTSSLPALLQVGTPAPDFVLPDHGNHLFKLAAQKGKWLVIYFYPKALTPGCTEQACAVQAAARDWQRLNTVVVGISADPPTRLATFRDKEQLDFPLLADADHAVADLYGAWQQRSMYGKMYMGVARVTYIVGPAGVIAHVLPKASPKTHAETVRNWLLAQQPDQLKGAGA